MTIITISIDDKTLLQYNKRAYKDDNSDRSKFLKKLVWTGTILNDDVYDIIARIALKNEETIDQIVNSILCKALNI